MPKHKTKTPIDVIFDRIRQNEFDDHVTISSYPKYKLRIDFVLHDILSKYEGDDYTGFSKWVYFYAYQAIMNTAVFEE